MKQTKEDFKAVYLNILAGLIVALLLSVINYVYKNPTADFAWIINNPLNFLKNIYFKYSIPMRLNMFIWAMVFFIYYILDKYDKQINIDEKRIVKEESFNNRVFFVYSFFTVVGLFYLDSISYENQILTIASNVIGLILTLIGFLILILSRVEIDGLWGPHIYEYKEPEFKRVVKSGFYSKLRHPIYFGQGILAASTVVLSQSIWFALFFLFVVVTNEIRAMKEEKHLLEQHTEEYEQYKKDVKKWWIF